MAAQSKVFSGWAVGGVLVTVLGFSLTTRSRAVDNQGQPCLADLGRLDQNFCVGPENSSTNGLLPRQSLKTYQWTIDRDNFLITAKLCAKNSQNASSFLDTVLVLDRSATMGIADQARSKIGQSADQLAEQIFRLYAEDSEKNQNEGVKLGIVIGSIFSECKEYQGENVTVDKDFNCLFIPSRDLKNQGQKDLITKLLMASKGKFAQSQRKVSGIDDSALLAAIDQRMGLAKVPGKKSLLLLSDGRAYRSSQTTDFTDPYPYLRIENYQSVVSRQKQLIRENSFGQYRIGYGLIPSPEPFYGDIYLGSMENICQISDPVPPAKDCNLSSIEFKKPKNWTINSWDPQREIQDILSYSPQNAVEIIRENQDVRVLLEKAAANDLETTPIDKVFYSVNGGIEREGKAQGSRFTAGIVPINLSELRAENGLNTGEISLAIHSGSAVYKFMINTEIEKLSKQESLKNSELVCPKLDFTLSPIQEELNLRGGGMSCAVLGVKSNKESRIDIFWWSLLICPILYVGYKRRINYLLAFLLIAKLTESVGFGQSNNDLQRNNINILTTRSTLSGVGLPETASIDSEKTWSGSFYLNYAESPLILSDESDIDKEVVDHLTVFHGVGEFRLSRKFVLGIEIPVIYQASIDRDKGSDRVLRGKEGRSSLIGKSGDIEFRGKFQVISLQNMAFGVMPVVQLPNGDENLLLGEKQAVYGIKILGSGGLGKESHRKNNPHHLSQYSLIWNINLGYLHRQEEIFKDNRSRPLEINGYSQLLSSLEYHVEHNWVVGTQYEFRYQNQSVFGLNENNPSEWGLFGRFLGPSSWSFATGVGVGIGEGVGAPSKRFWSGGYYSY